MKPHKHLLFKPSALKPPLGWMVCFGVLCMAVTEVDLQISFFSIISSIIHTSCQRHKAVNHRKQPRTALKLLIETSSGNTAPQRQQLPLVRVTPAHTSYILLDKSIQTAWQQSLCLFLLQPKQAETPLVSLSAHVPERTWLIP